MATKKLQVIITGTAKGAQKAFAAVGRSADGMQAKLAAVGKKIAKGLAVAGVGAAVLTGALAVKGVQAAVEFERGMNEVFTLLPDISGQAMGEMSQQVKDFSVEFGVLPQETIPALYQALSAGVPPGNVFDFLETAQKAAKGGVTDLTTAVDGISSVVNAYGSDVITAAEASDLMFTAVRLGKTNFEELSKSLFQVNPIASSLGVQFGDVTAALATMTAQGVPTSVATTQLRQAFVELSKDGSKTATLFEDLSGKTFKQFIAEGGNTQGALQLLEQAAADSGVGINDLFGSVEAGAAALALTGGNTDAFSGALGEMGASAGATDAAFARMNKGLGPLIDKAKAWAQVMLINLGEKLAPHLERLGRWLSREVPKAVDTARSTFDELRPAIEGIVSAASSVVDALRPVVEGFARFARNNPAPVLAAVATVIAFLLVPAVVALAAGINTAMIPIYLIIAAVALFVGALVWAYQNVGWFHDAVDAVGRFLRDTLWPAIQTVATWVGEHLVNAFNWAAGFVTGTVVPALQSLWAWFEVNILPALRDVAGAFISEVVPALEAGREKIATVIAKAQEMWSWFQANLLPVIQRVAAAARGPLGSALGFAGAMLSTMAGQAAGLARLLAGVLVGAIHGAANTIRATFSTAMAIGGASVSGVVAQARSLWNILTSIVSAARSAADAIRSIPSKIPGAGVVSGIGSALGFASGGRPPLGVPFWVGERGPELMVLDQPGTVIPNHQVRTPARRPVATAAAGGGGGDTYVIVHVAGSVRADRDLAQVIRSELIDIGRRSGRPVLGGT